VGHGEEWEGNDDYDLGYEYDEYLAEQKREIIASFTEQRLQSVYLDNPRLAQTARHRLDEARAVAPEHSSARLALAASAMEIGLRETLLRPVVAGLVHDETAAPFVTEIVLGQQAFERTSKLVLHILGLFGGDLRKVSRPGAKESLWQEMAWLRNRRNAVLHRGESPSIDEAVAATEIGAAIVETVFPDVVASVGLHLHEGNVCVNGFCLDRRQDSPAPSTAATETETKTTEPNHDDRPPF
jgi:hypothetical protein